MNFSSYSQSLKEIEKIETDHQDCLDTGIGMKNCSAEFYAISDSLLNVAYKNLKKKLNLFEQNELKNEQRKWLKERDRYFVKARNETLDENVGDENSNDFKMILYDKNAEFVFKRVKKLINRRTKIK